MAFGGSVIISLLPAGSVAAAETDSRKMTVKIYDGSTTRLEGSFAGSGAKLSGGGTVAAADVNNDGQKEIIVGAGVGSKPSVRIYRTDGTRIGEFFVFPATWKGGVKVASCDLDNDGKAEIIAGAGENSPPHIRTFTDKGEQVFTLGFYAFPKTRKGGVNVACGDVDGDGLRDIITGSGIGSNPEVKVFDRYGVSKDLDITPYASRDQGGVSVAVGNVDGGRASEIITGIYRFGRSRIKVYKANAARTVLAEFEGWPEEVQGGFNVASADVNGNKRDDIIVSVASGDSPQVRLFTGRGAPLTNVFAVYEKNFRGGVHVAAADLDGDSKAEFVVAPGAYTVQGNALFKKYIEVKLDEQRLYAYEKGKLVKTFLISSGIKKYPTPTGTFTISAKIPKKDYEWSYGDENPDNYDIKDVPWNLRFAPHYYLHNAFWHNNFGRPMSHGCININLANSKWLYDWAAIGVPVIIRGEPKW